MELIEFLEPTEKGVLQDVLSVFRGTREPDDGRVKTVLVSPDQNPECLGLARSARRHESLVVFTPAHHRIRRFHFARSSPETETAHWQCSLARQRSERHIPGKRDSTTSVLPGEEVC